DHLLPGPVAAHFDDLARDNYRNDSDGSEAGRGKRAIRSSGARHHWRADVVGDSYRLYRSSRVPSGVWERETQCSSESIVTAPLKTQVNQTFLRFFVSAMGQALGLRRPPRPLPSIGAGLRPLRRPRACPTE